MDLCVAGAIAAERGRKVLSYIGDTLWQRSDRCLTPMPRFPNRFASPCLAGKVHGSTLRCLAEHGRFFGRIVPVLESCQRNSCQHNGLRRELCPFR